MAEIDDVRWVGVGGLPFLSLVLSSEAATSAMTIFWVLAMRNQWLWAHSSQSMLWGSRERPIKLQSLQNSLIHWVPDWTLIGRMVERGDGIITMDGGYVMINFCCMTEGWWWRWWRRGWAGVIYAENKCVPYCRKCKRCKKTITFHFVESVVNSQILTSVALLV